MDYNNVTFHPAFVAAIRAEAERVKLKTVLGPQTFERVRAIVEQQPAEKRAAFYGTICEATCAGEDFSRVESIEDIGGIYARFIVCRAFGDGWK
ncbi:MAG: hypothetical protein VB053_02555 [Oscillibacter ruminantium]|uniref:hypothetical protein n=1 Tax=Oscillibacter ruminantium TaxID=1263547 RepID=UPI002B1F5052|nr:hypothetical protein [Oscillibacter ruminantium]MEA5041401.1 hypothetical protein [Oscillibacter ruminantium]